MAENRMRHEPPPRNPGDAGAPSPAPEFYVGYLPTPAGLRIFLVGFVPVLLAFVFAAGALIARWHADPGAGVWHDGQAREYIGLIDCKPYPMLRFATDDKDRPVDTLLLVEVGKFGGGQRARPFDGQYLRVKGYLLERDGRRMLELLPGQEAFEHVGAAHTPHAERLVRPTGPLFALDTPLKGEIVDTKCYLGAMKPGDGKTHKECATLCVKGGIPPTLLTRDIDGVATYYILCDPAGNALDERVLPFVGDLVEIRGDVERLGELLLFHVDPANIQRL